MDRDDVDNNNRSELPRLINDDIGACGASDRQSYVCMQPGIMASSATISMDMLSLVAPFDTP